MRSLSSPARYCGTIVLLAALFCAGSLRAGAQALLPSSQLSAPSHTRPELTLQLGHTDAVFSVAVSPNGKLLASGSLDRAIKVWDVVSGELLHTLAADGGPPGALAFSPDSGILVSESRRWGHQTPSDEIKVWDVQRGGLLRTLRTGTININGVAFTPDGKTLMVSSANGTVQFLDAQTEEVVWSVPGPGGISSGSDWGRAALSPDGNLLATAFARAVTVRNVATHTVIQTLPDPGWEGVESLVFSSDGSLLVSMGRSEVQVWDTRAWTLVQNTMIYDYYLRAAAIVNGQVPLVACAGDRYVTVLNARTGEVLHRLKGSGGVIQSLAPSPDSKTLVSSGQDATLRLWDVRTGMMRRWIPSPGNGVTSHSFVKGSLAVASGAVDNTIRLWDVQTGKMRWAAKLASWPNKVAQSPDGRMVAVATQDVSSFRGSQQMNTNGPGEVNLRDARSGRLLRILSGHRYPVQAVAFSPNSRIIASGSGDRQVKLWDAQSGRLLSTFIHGYAADSGVRAVAFSPDGSVLASGGYDRRIKLWRVRGGRLLRTLRESEDIEVMSLGFSLDGKMLASASQSYYSNKGNVRLWDVRTGRLKRIIRGNGPVATVALLSAGRVIAAGFADGSVRLWDTKTGRLIHTLQTGKAVHTTVFITSSTLASGDASNRVMLWSVRSGRLLLTLQGLPAKTEEATPTAWIAYTPEGYYDASPGAGKFVRWRVGDQLYPHEKYERQFDRPDVVQKVLRGR